MSELRVPCINKVVVAGRLTRDPESKTLDNGSVLCKFGVAVTEYYRTKSGERKEDTNFFNVTCWNKLAEFIVAHIHKGDPVYIEGKTRNYEYTTKEGERRHASEIVATSIQQLAWHGSEKKESAPPPVEQEDDIPF